jgi:hypothetical protein
MACKKDKGIPKKGGMPPGFPPKPDKKKKK